MHRILMVLLLLLNVLLIFDACTDHPAPHKKVDPNESAIPHGSALPVTSLSEEDRQKLASAAGIVAAPMKVEDLVYLIDKGSKGLNIYCLWTLDCPKCDELLGHLNRLKEELDPNKVAIHQINVNLIDDPSEVNAHIRAIGLINNNYILSGLEDYKSDQPYSKLFNSDLPVLLLANNKDGTQLIYTQSFSYEELYALIQPLII